jgi:hypothetical protein
LRIALALAFLLWMRFAARKPRIISAPIISSPILALDGAPAVSDIGHSRIAWRFRPIGTRRFIFARHRPSHSPLLVEPQSAELARVNYACFRLSSGVAGAVLAASNRAPLALRQRDVNS